MDSREHFDEPVLNYASRDFTALRENITVDDALRTIRETGIGEKIIYFYVVDEDRTLIGVLPIRRLLSAPLDTRISDIMVPRVVAVPRTATVLDACEFFILHKFLAFPVVDEQRRMIAVVDISLFAKEVLDISERERVDDVFQAIGFRISQLQNASLGKAFRLRFPWLLATIVSGTLCALLAGAFERTLAESLMIAFFLTLVLGLGESVSIQSMALTVQALHLARPTWRFYLKAFQREVGTALLLGLGAGSVVALFVLLWHKTFIGALVVGGSILLSLVMACILGLSVPVVLHRLRLDPKIAAGPITLGLADIFTLLFYFSLAFFFL